jgi:uncharacterized protein involved in exopolysaccharide biosynthesis
MADPIPIDESHLEASQRQFVNMAQLAEVSEELARVKELQLDWRLRQLDDNADKRKELAEIKQMVADMVETMRAEHAEIKDTMRAEHAEIKQMVADMVETMRAEHAEIKELIAIIVDTMKENEEIRAEQAEVRAYFESSNHS